MVVDEDGCARKAVHENRRTGPRYDASMFPKKYKIILADSTAKLERRV